MQRGTYGFWRGVLFGFVVAVLAGLALAWVFPPLRAPEVDDSMQVPPAQPGTPGGGAGGAPLLTPAPGALVEGLPEPPRHPQEQAPDAPAGSPSLVPGAPGRRPLTE